MKFVTYDLLGTSLVLSSPNKPDEVKIKFVGFSGSKNEGEGEVIKGFRGSNGNKKVRFLFTWILSPQFPPFSSTSYHFLWLPFLKCKKQGKDVTFVFYFLKAWNSCLFFFENVGLTGRWMIIRFLKWTLIEPEANFQIN